MNRYFYYNIIMVSMLNLMLFVPYLLLQYRYTGAIMSMLCAVIVGSAVSIIFTFVMQAYPGKGMPEILALYFRPYVIIPIMLFMAFMWFTASSITLYAYAVLINRFLNPDTSSLVVLGFLVIVCVYGSTRSMLTIIFVLEMGLLLSAPLILFILFKAARNPLLDWDAIQTIGHYWNQTPKMKPFAAATFLFTGYINFIMFNRLHAPNFRFRFRWIIPIFCSGIMLISFFIPIGLHGTEAAGSYLYIWSVTSDSLVMSYGFIERVIFVFLILYLNLTLIFATVGWHLAIEMIKSCLPKSKPRIDPPRTPKAKWVIACLFACLTLLYSYLFDEKQNLEITGYWLVFRFYMEIILVIFLTILTIKNRRKKLPS
ncbi:hypothetical protein [Paenibacillus sp. R14(2021)]|uniref:hypothetical protein n=1 Tax=Paenibacillus sp. R14(2021) TaxID=2859228 RepID=UPI001C614443|nr:hypothetical protein [Paenibacillus sp. R14(2021)]